jgi:hypothetical protein
MTVVRPKDHFKIRLQALQVAACLPENPHQALRILAAARQIVIDGMGDDNNDNDGNVFSIVKPDGAA